MVKSRSPDDVSCLYPLQSFSFTLMLDRLELYPTIYET